jgi:hypothetical protein
MTDFMNSVFFNQGGLSALYRTKDQNVSQAPSRQATAEAITFGA